MNFTRLIFPIRNVNMKCLFLLAYFVTNSMVARGANLLVNGDFETEPNFGPTATIDVSYAGFVVLTGTQLPGWTIEPGHGITVQTSNGALAIGGTYSVNTDGEGYNLHNSDFYQDVPSIAGKLYQLDFDWQSWYYSVRLNLSVTVEDTVDHAVLFSGLYSWDGLPMHHVSSMFLGTGEPLRLRIREIPESGFNDNAFVVDNFSVSSVPEPVSMVTSLLGIVCVAGICRFQRTSRIR